jgi:hypothetical protein
MFDISLFELLVILLVAVLALKPQDIRELFLKFRNFNHKLTIENILKDDFLDFKEVQEIETKKTDLNLKNATKGKE